MLKIKEGTCFLGKTLDIEHKDVCLSVTLDVGPRIISLSRKGSKDIMFHDLQDEVHKEIGHIYGGDKVWHLYGGHRIWVSPEDESTYYPDNYPVTYVVKDNVITFTPKVWEVVNLQPVLELEFLSSGSIIVRMSITNIGVSDRKLALWGLSVLRNGGVLEVPLSKKNTGYLANRNLVIWHYTDIKDKRLEIHNDKIVLRGDAKAKGPLKVGTLVENLKTIFTLEDTVFTKEVEYEAGEYPDMHCNMETYTSHLIHEVETLSPLKTLKPGDKISLIEKWTLSKA